jgi:hypothetical protein
MMLVLPVAMIGGVAGAAMCPSDCPGPDDTARVQYALDHADEVYFDRDYQVRSVTIHRLGQHVEFRGHALRATGAESSSPARADLPACLVITGRQLTLRDVTVDAGYHVPVAVHWHSVDRTHPAQFNRVDGLHIARAKIGLLYGAMDNPVDSPQSENVITGMKFRGAHQCIYVNQPNGFLFISQSVLDCNPYEWTQERPGAFDDETARAIHVECGHLAVTNSEILKTFTQRGHMIELGWAGTLKLSNCHFETGAAGVLLGGRLWGTNLTGRVTGDSQPVIDVETPVATKLEPNAAIDFPPVASLANVELRRNLAIARYSGIPVVRSAPGAEDDEPARVWLRGAVIEGWRPERLDAGGARVTASDVLFRYHDAKNRPASRVVGSRQ